MSKIPSTPKWDENGKYIVKYEEHRFENVSIDNNETIVLDKEKVKEVRDYLSKILEEMK